ncbi:MAG: leucine-rich repeat protein [Eubacteriaceae bacterium]
MKKRRMKELFTLVLTLAIIFGGANMPQVKAATFSVTKDGIAFTLDDSTNTATVTSYDGSQGFEIDIPPTVMDGLTSYSVTAIGYAAFEDTGLIRVSIPEGVTTIEDYAFFNNQLISVTVPEGVTTIGEWAFSRNQLTSVTIPEGVMTIGYAAFFNNQLTSVTIPEGVTTIEGGAFSQNQLTSVTIPEGVTTIENVAFSYNQLISVTIPEGVTTIDFGAFAVNPLETIFIPNFAKMEAMKTILTENDGLFGVTSGAVKMYALDHVSGDYSSGTASSYTLNEGNSLLLAVGEITNPQVAKYDTQSGGWIDPDPISLPVDPSTVTIEWYQKVDGQPDTLVETGESFNLWDVNVNDIGAYYAKINDTLQLSDIALEVIPSTLPELGPITLQGTPITAHEEVIFDNKLSEYQLHYGAEKNTYGIGYQTTLPLSEMFNALENAFLEYRMGYGVGSFDIKTTLDHRLTVDAQELTKEKMQALFLSKNTDDVNALFEIGDVTYDEGTKTITTQISIKGEIDQGRLDQIKNQAGKLPSTMEIGTPKGAIALPQNDFTAEAPNHLIKTKDTKIEGKITIKVIPTRMPKETRGVERDDVATLSIGGSAPENTVIMKKGTTPVNPTNPTNPGAGTTTPSKGSKANPKTGLTQEMMIPIFFLMTLGAGSMLYIRKRKFTK